MLRSSKRSVPALVRIRSRIASRLVTPPGIEAWPKSIVPLGGTLLETNRAVILPAAFMTSVVVGLYASARLAALTPYQPAKTYPPIGVAEMVAVVPAV